MNKKNLLCVSLLSLSLVGCFGGEKKEPAKPQSNLVKTVVLGPTKITATRRFPGQVIAGRRVVLAFLVTGQLVELPIVRGQVVEQNQLIARLDPRDFSNNLAEQQAKLDKARLDLNRAAQLLSSGTVPQATYDAAKEAHDVALANKRIAKKALEDTYLRAPFGGLIADRFVENYEHIKEKQNIVSLQDIEHIDIEINIAEHDIVKAKAVTEHVKGRTKKIEDGYVLFDALPGRRFDVALKEFTTTADPVTQTYKITLTMPSPKDVNILPGMSATLLILDKDAAAETTFDLPLEAVGIDTAGKYFVWRVDPASLKVQKQFVTVGELRKDAIRVTQGIHVGDRLVVAGVPYLEEGMTVRIYE